MDNSVLDFLNGMSGLFTLGMLLGGAWWASWMTVTLKRGERSRGRLHEKVDKTQEKVSHIETYLEIKGNGFTPH